MLEQVTTEETGGLSLELTADNAGLSEQARYVVRLPLFEGPLDLLLHLIEKRQTEAASEDEVDLY
jgi:segregation and condensation protein A